MPVATKNIVLNRCEAWETYCLTLEPVIKAMAAKFCQSDEEMREDLAQEMRVAVRTVFPEKVRGYDDFLSGKLAKEAWDARLDAYARNAARNAGLSWLDSFTYGPWTHGRNRPGPNGTRYHLPARYDSIDDLQDTRGLQIDDTGAVSFDNGEDIENGSYARDAGDNEDAILNHLAMESLLSQMDGLLSQLLADEQAVIDDYLRHGIANRVPGGSRAYQRVLYKLRTLAGTEQQCPVCQRVMAMPAFHAQSATCRECGRRAIAKRKAKAA